MFKKVQATTPYRIGKELINTIGAHFSYNSTTDQKWTYVPADPSAVAVAPPGTPAMVIDEEVFVEQMESSITVTAGIAAIASMSQLAFSFFIHNRSSFRVLVIMSKHEYKEMLFLGAERSNRSNVNVQPNMSPERSATDQFVCPRVSTLVNGLYSCMNQHWEAPYARSFLASLFQLGMEAAQEGAVRSFDTITATWKRDALVGFPLS